MSSPQDAEDGGGRPSPVVSSGNGPRFRRARRLGALGAVTILGAVVALAGLGTYSPRQGRVGPGTVAVRARWHVGGRTEVRLPPLGRVTARTHAAPVALETRVDQVDVDALQDLLKRPEPATALRRVVTRDLRPLLRSLLQRTLLIALLVGGVAGALVPGRRWPHVACGAVGGVVAVAALMGLAWRGFDERAFQDPRFDGPIERAPAILKTVRRHVEGFEQVQDRIDALGGQVADLYASAAGDAVGDAQETAILHVSDVHLNPIGLEVTRRLAESFDVDAVLDTGDLTSFGYPLEAGIGELITRIPVPYYFVPGNHDSAENRVALAQAPNVRLLDGQAASIGGVSILGVADPTFTADNQLSASAAAAIKRQRASDVTALLEEQRPDVLAVHDPLLAGEAWGHVPVVVAGHVHKRGARLREGTRLLTVGSTGATGLGSFTVATDLPYEAQILRFDGARLIAVDYVSLRGVEGSFRVDRQLVPDDPGEEAQPPIGT